MKKKAVKAEKSSPKSSSKSKVAVAKPGVDVVDFNFIGSKEESAETRTIASRERVRTQLDCEIEAFLSQGGKIDNVAPNVMGDPPRKPESNYGSRPI